MVAVVAAVHEKKIAAAAAAAVDGACLPFVNAVVVAATAEV